MPIARLFKALPLAIALAAVPAVAQDAPTPDAKAEAPRSILFIGNSFTQGAHSAAVRYGAASVTDLNGNGIGGVPALFHRFAEESGEAWTVSHELRGGRTLAQHLVDRPDVFAKPWDVVVMQEFSVLDPKNPGNPAATLKSAPAIAGAVTRANPDVRVYMTATWSRADLTYKPDGHWYGQPIDRMARDLRVALDSVDAASDDIDGVIPVGEAWNRAMGEGVADPNPYDGVGFGKLDLWTYDQYHASAAGYYLEALVVFGRVTGIDPRTLGDKETAAYDIGLSPHSAAALQRVAAEQLGLPAAPDRVRTP